MNPTTERKFTKSCFCFLGVTFAGSSVSDWSSHVSVKPLLAVVAVPPSCIVSAVHADPAALSSGQLVQLHVESATAGMEVAVACCKDRRKYFIYACVDEQFPLNITLFTHVRSCKNICTAMCIT